MAATITLRRETIDQGEAPLQGYYLKVSAINPVDMPAEIFIFQRNRIIINGELPDDSDNDTFVSVADPVDLQEYPITRPADTDDEVFYRQAQINLWFRSMQELEEVWGDIKEDVSGLVKALRAADNLSSVEEITING